MKSLLIKTKLAFDHYRQQYPNGRYADPALKQKAVDCLATHPLKEVSRLLGLDRKFTVVLRS